MIFAERKGKRREKRKRIFLTKRYLDADYRAIDSLPRQRKPWCRRPLRYLWHLSHFSSTLKLWGIRVWGELPVATDPLPPTIASLATLTEDAFNVVVEADNVAPTTGVWQSSSMQAKMVFWWKSSLMPIFYEQENQDVAARSLNVKSEIITYVASTLKSTPRKLVELFQQIFSLFRWLWFET